MGFFSRIKEAAKKVAGVVKKTVQTVIPGGSKGFLEPKAAPTQAPAPTPTPSPTTQRSSDSTRDRISSIIDRTKEVGGDVIEQLSNLVEGKDVTIGDTTIPTGFGGMTDPETGEEIQLQMGTLPIGLASGTTAVKGFLNWGKTISKTQKVGKISKTGKQVQTNTKTVSLVNKILSKAFSTKALLFYGAWAGSVGMNLWAQAEAPEGIMFPVTKFLIPEAQRTGDWSAVDEALLLADEVSDIGFWEKWIGMSPIAIVPGALNKLRGNIAGKEILKRYREDQKVKFETGQTEA